MFTEQVFANVLAGNFGVEGVTDTNAHIGPFGVLVPLEATVLAAITSQYLTGNSLVGETLPAGVPIVIPHITTLTLTSGALLAYRMPASAR
jgi:hypothetical protein